MLSRIDYQGLSWVDIQSPTPEEISKIAREFNLPYRVGEELLRPSFHPKSESYGDFIYLILPLPLYDRRQKHHRSRELDIILGSNFLLTVHFEQIEPLRAYFDKLEIDLNTRRETFSKNSEKIIYQLWMTLYDALLHDLDYMQNRVQRIEERIFSSEKDQLIQEMTNLRRDALDFSRAIRPHGLVIDEFTPLAKEMYGAESIADIHDLSHHFRRLLALAENDSDALEILYDTYNALENRRSTEITKIFTMLALLTFPLTLIAGIFAIETVSRPIVGLEYDFWIIIGIMVAVVISMLFYFKSKRWI